jgi:hypothetical protein
MMWDQFRTDRKIDRQGLGEPYKFERYEKDKGEVKATFIKMGSSFDGRSNVYDIHITGTVSLSKPELEAVLHHNKKHPRHAHTAAVTS